jgi:hypothetical protein
LAQDSDAHGGRSKKRTPVGCFGDFHGSDMVVGCIYQNKIKLIKENISIFLNLN